jgi:hypothetical protein
VSLFRELFLAKSI